MVHMGFFLKQNQCFYLGIDLLFNVIMTFLLNAFNPLRDTG